MPDIYFEDVQEGQEYDLGSFTLSKEEITAFGERYDPQPFHVDEEAARETIFGGLIASGWQTAALCSRQFVVEFLNHTDSMGGMGLEELMWPTPVRPGDEISVEIEILDTRPSESRDDRGYFRNRVSGHNQDGEEVIHWEGLNIVGTRDG